MQNHTKVKEIKEEILATLAYFDASDYPLTGNEIYLFLRRKTDHAEFIQALKYLVARQSVHQFGEHYTLQNNHMLVVDRIEHNQLNTQKITGANRLSNKLAQFPYVRGIAMVGPQFRKQNVVKPTIDLMIITVKNRLWIVRSLIYLFGKLGGLMTNKFAIRADYYLAANHLQIEEKDIHNAIEMATLIPLQGDLMIEQFYAANSWTRYYLPHQIMRLSTAKSLKSSFFKTLIERLFDNALGDFIDNRLMRYTVANWTNKARQSKLPGFMHIPRAEKHFIKPNRQSFGFDLNPPRPGDIPQRKVGQPNQLAN